MNKRDFIVQGGSALLSSATLGSAWAAHTGSPSPELADQAGSSSAQARWQALMGQGFHSQTGMGRPVTLTLLAVSDKGASPAASRLEQFTVSFQGPRALPLKPGLHELTHPQAGQVHLYLEPVPQGEHIHYDAHFSLLS
ncbi:MAG TPA: hypothetical protein VFW93_07735 [Aquabacterium sp.]|uniref:DUF6916 family protein n=1 Tax=Aquabacterium sp. TaxID=1872578 RepID=UPI002E300EAD|nr:hypothetical protein [Aquabacterium sp.]HEX5356093.1 hypothetical protein [Aquabacterium sp.]